MNMNSNDFNANAGAGAVVEETSAKATDTDDVSDDGEEELSNVSEEEKIEEDAQVQDDVGQFKTPEDEQKKASSEEGDQVVHEKIDDDAIAAANVHKDMQYGDHNKGGVNSSPRKGTIATIPDNNNDNNDTGSNEGDANAPDAVAPGIMFVAGPNYTGRGIHTGYNSDSDDGNTVNINETSVIVQGFLPEDDPSRRSSRQSRAERSAEERIQRLIDNAITLDDSAVQPIPMEDEVDEEGNNGSEGARGSNRSEEDDEALKSDRPPGWVVLFFVLLAALIIILSIVVPMIFRGKSADTAQDSTTPSFIEGVCLPGGVDARFEVAKSIISIITSAELLDDESSPQGKAIRWIACEDSISLHLLGNQDLSTGTLPKQKNGFRYSGDSGEEQVLRRYILATLYYSTSEDSPWADSLNFLSPDLHECNWHKNYTRNNFPFFEFDPVGVFCMIDKGELSSPTGVHEEILLNDEDYPLRYLGLNIRIDNNLNGPLPEELGYLLDCRNLLVENQVRLTGSLPQTMGSMMYLYSISLIVNGPKFGGEIPSSLFGITELYSIHIEDNLGKDWSLPSSVQVGEDTQLERLILSGCGVNGNIPSWLSQLTSLTTLTLTKNNFQGAIPEAMGNMSSLKFLSLMENNLTEAIPSSLGRLPEIEMLILGSNKLQGELPASIGNLDTLYLLDVGSNELKSTIPSSFANLTNLKYLVLETNNFTGTVDVLASLKNLTHLFIRSNSFTGTLPEGMFAEIYEDVAVDVGDNSFKGDLPTNFANMSNLVSLIGAGNSFDDNSVQAGVCNNTSMLVMDCGACECCRVCCDGNNDALCDFKLDVKTVLGYQCGTWLRYCLQGAEYFEEFGVY